MPAHKYTYKRKKAARHPGYAGKSAAFLQACRRAAVTVFFLFAGIMAGVCITGSVGDTQVNAVKRPIIEALDQYASPASERSEAFWESFIKYQGVALLIWLLAYLPAGPVLAEGVIFAKGIGYGYTTMLLYKLYGTESLLYASALYLPQNAILIPVLIWLSVGNRHYYRITRQNGKRNSKTSIPAQPQEGKHFFHYALTLLVATACVALAAFVEAFIGPRLAAGIL